MSFAKARFKLLGEETSLERMAVMDVDSLMSSRLVVVGLCLL